MVLHQASAFSSLSLTVIIHCGRQAPTRTCDACEGSGICSECKGEGFVVKRLSEESAERARLMSKNAATRYTAG